MNNLVSSGNASCSRILATLPEVNQCCTRNRNKSPERRLKDDKCRDIASSPAMRKTQESWLGALCSDSGACILTVVR